MLNLAFGIQLLVLKVENPKHWAFDIHILALKVEDQSIGLSILNFQC